MAYTPNPGQFSLFKNDKRGNDKAPDYRGDGLALDGTPIRVAAWLKEGKNGSKFLSCKLEVPQQKAAQRPTPSDDDDVPF